jgi:hypothetical protein
MSYLIYNGIKFTMYMQNLWILRKGRECLITIITLMTLIILITQITLITI